jgi:Trypsin-co-occurring domain 1
MAFLVEVPVEGGQLFVEAGPAELPGDLELAARRPGEIVAHASQTLEQSLDQIKPGITAMVRRLKAMSPDAITVEFGLVVGAEYGIVVAKGTGEVHFTVTMSWGKGDPGGGDA